MTRNELKGLIKECLVEILTEGAGAAPMRESKVRQAPVAPPPQKRHPALDSIAIPKKQQVEAPQQRRPAPQPQNFSAITNDPMMASIFADTASTTLMEQVNADRGVAAAVNTGVDPSVFEGAANWASLAFSDSPRKNH
jgi:hypothetical protein